MESAASTGSNGTGSNGIGAADALESFGPRLRSARLERGLSLRAFAAELGVSPSAVSQIESGKTRPSMKRLHDIVRVLGIGLEDVFDSGGPVREPLPADIGDVGHRGDPLSGRPFPDWDGIPYLATADQARLRLEDGVEWFQISPVRLPDLEVLRTVYPAGARAGENVEFVQHNGWEMGYVLSGRMRIQVGFAYREVGPSESICFDSSLPHRISNPFDEPAVAVWIRSIRPMPS